MTRLPAATPQEVIRAYKHSTRPGQVVVPFHRRDLKRGTLLSILKQAGLSRQQFLELL